LSIVVHIDRDVGNSERHIDVWILMLRSAAAHRPVITATCFFVLALGSGTALKRDVFVMPGCVGG